MSASYLRIRAWPKEGPRGGNIAPCTFRQRIWDVNTILRKFFGWSRGTHAIHKVRQGETWVGYQYRWPADQFVPNGRRRRGKGAGVMMKPPFRVYRQPTPRQRRKLIRWELWHSMPRCFYCLAELRGARRPSITCIPATAAETTTPATWCSRVACATSSKGIPISYRPSSAWPTPAAWRPWVARAELLTGCEAGGLEMTNRHGHCGRGNL